MSSSPRNFFFFLSLHPHISRVYQRVASQSTSVRPLERADLSIFGSKRRCAAVGSLRFFFWFAVGLLRFHSFFFPFFFIFFFSIPASGQSVFELRHPREYSGGRCHSDSGRSGGVRKANFGAHK